MAFTDYGSHGILDTPSGSVLLRPEQYATFGVAPPPAVDEPPPTPGVVPANPEPPPLATPAFAPPPVDPTTQVSRPDDGFGVAPGPGAVSTPAPPQSVDPALVSSPAPAASAPLPVAPEAAALPASAPLPTDLSKATYGDVLAEQQAAINQGTQAGVAALAAETKNNDATARALEQRNADIAAKQQEFAQREAEDQKRLADTTKLFEAKVKEFADKKVDRANYGVSPMQAIGVALSGIGSAYKGQGDKNPALDLLLSQIDKYVDDQYRAKESLGQEAGLIKSQLGVFQDAASNTQAQKQLAVAGILDRSVRDMEAMAPKMQNQLAASRLLGLSAAAAQESAARKLAAVQLQHGDDQEKARLAEQTRARKAQIGLGYAQLRENARQADLSFAQHIADEEQKRADAIAAAKTEDERRAAKISVPDLQSVDAQGNPITYQAREGSKENPGTIALDVVEKFAAVKTLDGIMAEAIRLKKKYPDFAKLKYSPEYQKLKANITEAAVAWSKVHRMGTWDLGSERASLGALGGDPMRESYFADLMEDRLQGNSTAGMEQFRANAARDFNTYAETARLPGTKYIPWEPQPIEFGTPGVERRTDQQLQGILKEKTPVETIEAADPNKVQRGLGYVASALDTPGTPYETNQQGIAKQEALRKQENPGGLLTKKQAESIEDIASVAYKGQGDKAAAAKAVLEGIALRSDRPQLQQRALDVLAKNNDTEALGRIETQLVANARTEQDQDAARLPIRLALDTEARRRAANDPSKRERPSVEVLADQATRGDREAAALLGDMALGKPIGKFGKPSTDDQFKALMAVQALARSRGGR